LVHQEREQWSGMVKVEKIVDQLLQGGGVTRWEGVRNASPARDLPESHRALLTLTNGIDVFGGYYRLFGAGESCNTDMSEWNEVQSWKFAWPQSTAHRFLCFGETAWGDQFAYALDELGRRDPRVYFLGGFTMNASLLAKSFEHFLERTFLRTAFRPGDSVLIGARRRLGDLTPRQHIVYVPSLLLGGCDERVENVSVMAARAAMVVNGDLHTQLSEAGNDREVCRVEGFTDSLDNPRVQVLWVDKVE